MSTLRRITVPAVVGFLIICLSSVTAGILARTSASNEPLGFVVFLLVFATPILAGMAFAASAWQATRSISEKVGIPESLLVAMAVFVITCGCGPLAITFVAMVLTAHDGPIGATGIWALASLAISIVLVVIAILVAFIRYLSHRQPREASETSGKT